MLQTHQSDNCSHALKSLPGGTSSAVVLGPGGVAAVAAGSGWSTCIDMARACCSSSSSSMGWASSSPAAAAAGATPAQKAKRGDTCCRRSVGGSEHDVPCRLDVARVVGLRCVLMAPTTKDSFPAPALRQAACLLMDPQRPSHGHTPNAAGASPPLAAEAAQPAHDQRPSSAACSWSHAAYLLKRRPCRHHSGSHCHSGCYQADTTMPLDFS